MLVYSKLINLFYKNIIVKYVIQIIDYYNLNTFLFEMWFFWNQSQWSAYRSSIGALLGSSLESITDNGESQFDKHEPLLY